MPLDRDTIRTLADANGLPIPDERLDLVLRQYLAFLRTIEKIDTVVHSREAEPAIVFSPTGVVGAPDVPGRRTP